MSELARVCAPGGNVIVVTWCHRVLQPGEKLTEEEQSLLDRICEAYYLPEWCSVADYETMFGKCATLQTVVWSTRTAAILCQSNRVVHVCNRIHC